MPYSDEVLRRAQARLAAARSERERENDARIQAIYRRCPRLLEIDRQLRATVAQAMAAAFRKGEDPAAAIARLREENLSLQREREWLLESEGIDEADLQAEPICAICGGTGYVGERMCDAFRLDLYSDAPDPKLGVSPREVMHQIFQRCRRYAAEFSLRSPSLLMSGGTGVGKTFLSAAIARTVADAGFSVVYDTAGRIFSDFEEEKFGSGTHLTGKYRRCDLLILDDLGTEMTTQFTLSALYDLVNGRLLAGLPSIISTNLTTAELRSRYTPQIASRLLGRYERLPFAGSDIRLLRR